MLPISFKHFSKSVQHHNVQITVLCDWIEGSVLFDDIRDHISQYDVADNLLDNLVYEDQTFALEVVTAGWLEIRSRIEASKGGLGYVIDGKRIRRIGNWRDYPGHSFCLLVSLATVYDWWKEPNYLEQGEIFELLTKCSFEAQFPMWNVYRTGWSRNKTKHLRDVATEVAAELDEEIGDMGTWDSKGSKEMGLDLLCYRPFLDSRRGIPVYMMQCASGRNWDTKLHTPDLGVWRSLIQFKNEPVKAFSIPFTMSSNDYNRSIVRVKGLFFERCRILAAATCKEDWMPKDLKDQIVAWCEPRVERLLEKNNY